MPSGAQLISRVEGICGSEPVLTHQAAAELGAHKARLLPAGEGS